MSLGERSQGMGKNWAPGLPAHWLCEYTSVQNPFELPNSPTRGHEKSVVCFHFTDEESIVCFHFTDEESVVCFHLTDEKSGSSKKGNILAKSDSKREADL